MLKLDGKKETSLEIYQFWHKEMIYKSGKRLKTMDKVGWL